MHPSSCFVVARHAFLVIALSAAPEGGQCPADPLARQYNHRCSALPASNIRPSPSRRVHQRPAPCTIRDASRNTTAENSHTRRYLKYHRR